MKKRILSIALVVAMIVVMIPAMLLPTAAIGYYDGYEGARVNSEAITVDANATPDEAYLAGEKIVNQLTYNDRNSSGESTSFEAYIAADDYGFYFWISIEDASLNKGDGYEATTVDPATGVESSEHKIVNASGGDRVQLYIKADAAGASTGRNTKVLGSFGFDYLNQFNVQQNPNDTKGVFTTEGATLATTTNAKGWVAELYIPWVNLAHFDDKASGFEGYTTDDMTSFNIGVQVNNYTNDGKDAQRSYAYDTAQGGSYYQGITNKHSFSKDNVNKPNYCFNGTRLVPVNFIGLRAAVVTDTITVDGEMDDAYLKSPKLPVEPASGGYENLTGYVVATVDGIYIFADIIDYTLDKPEGEVLGEGDKFQVYFQMGNPLSNTNWGYVEMDYRSDDWFNYTNKATKWFDYAPSKDEMLHAYTKKYDANGNALGWTAELFLPWSGSMAVDGISDLTQTNVKLMIQAGDYTSTPDGTSFKRTCNSLSYSNRWGAAAWYDVNGTYGPSGNYYMVPVIFDFEADTPNYVKRGAKYVDSITLDGVKDDKYTSYVNDQVSFVYKQSSEVADREIPYLANVYYAFTDTDAYVFVEVNDSTVSSTSKYEYTTVYYETAEHVGKFALGANGSFNTNSKYESNYTIDYVLYDGTNADKANLALTYVGTKEAYTGYNVEFKIALTDTEKAALAAGEAVNIGIGVEVNDAQADGTRLYYGYSSSGVAACWVNDDQTRGIVAMPRVRLDKTITDDTFGITPEITGAQVALGESINMNYFVNLPLNATNAKMKFTFNDEVTYANAAIGEKANEYVFTFEGIAPQCMKDNIKAELIVDGEVVATKDNYNVWQNTFDVWANDSSNAKLTSLVGDLWAYGAAAQKYANYKTDDLINKGYTHFATPVNSIADDKTLTQGEDITFKAAGVYFDNINKLYAKVIIPAGALEMDDFAVTVNGAPVAFEATGNEDEYIIYTGDILVTEFDEYFTFVVTDGVDTATLKYSVNAYCKAKLNAEKEATAALAAATYAYGASAEAYQG